jgi:AraC family transcriptional regulator
LHPITTEQHLYMPNVVFARLTNDYNLPAVPGRSIRYSCGVQDEVINQTGLSVLSEMRCPTAAGRMLVETSSLLLAARLGAHALRDGAHPAADTVETSVG